jgi:hypothetical protein
MFWMFNECTSLSSLTLGAGFAFKNNTHLPDAPSTAPHTGKWVRQDGAGEALTTAQLAANYNGATMAGTYVWECTHSFSGDPVWSWAEGYRSATATFTCIGCGEVTAEDNNPELVEVSAATCTADRVIKYTARVTVKDTEYIGETNNITVANTAMHHDYRFDSFVWNSNTAQAKYVCANDENHVEYYDAAVTSETTPPTATEDGYTVYTAAYDGHTESITVIDAGSAAGDGPGVCELCGEVHDVTTVTGFFTDMLHDMLYIVTRLAMFFCYEIYVC